MLEWWNKFIYAIFPYPLQKLKIYGKILILSYQAISMVS